MRLVELHGTLHADAGVFLQMPVADKVRRDDAEQAAATVRMHRDLHERSGRTDDGQLRDISRHDIIGQKIMKIEFLSNLIQKIRKAGLLDEVSFIVFRHDDLSRQTADVLHVGFLCIDEEEVLLP